MMVTMRVSITRTILEKIGEAGVLTLDAFLPRQYSYTLPSRKLLGLDSYPKATPRTISALLSRLKRQGLVVRHGAPGRSSWTISKKGVVWLKSNPMPEVPAKDGISRLVIFDIPERERKKRDTVRAELIASHFRKLQKSVWIGENPLPEDFIALVDDLRLKGKLHIFSIRESGTIEEN